MAKFRFGFRTLAALTLLGGLKHPAFAANATPEQILLYKPRQPGVEITTPTDAEVKSCTLEVEEGKKFPNNKQATAWVLKDGSGKVLRKFHDTTGEGGVDLYSYYRDGEEVFRELDTDRNKQIDQYRWVGAAGSKWGSDKDEDGKIDSWLAISPEELSQELLAAVVANNVKRFEALLVTPADLDALGLPKADVTRIQGKAAQAQAQFQKTRQDLAKISPQTIWVHLETKPPHTTPADAIDAKADYTRYRHATILYQEGDGKEAKHNWLQTGEIVQVGKAWKVIQAPTAGMQPPPDDGALPGARADGGGFTIPAGAEKLIEELGELDKKGPGAGRDGVVAFNIKRAGILERIAALITKPEERAKRDPWLRQVADCYATAAQNLDKSALDRLTQWRDAVAKDREAGALLAYFQFRVMSAEYTVELSKIGRDSDKLTKVQEAWKEKLKKFVADHPTADDVPDALMQLAVVNEFLGPKYDAEAKAAYARLARDFPKHPLARRAQGSQDRLSLEGNELDVSGPVLGGGATADVKSLKGKAVVVYYWASWNEAAVADFAKIKAAVAGFAGKVELIGVNLDNRPEDAAAFLKANAVGGTHLHTPGGLESPLALRYGVTLLPVMFVAGPDGKVVNRAAQAATLDEDLRKIFKDGKEK